LKIILDFTINENNIGFQNKSEKYVGFQKSENYIDVKKDEFKMSGYSIENIVIIN